MVRRLQKRRGEDEKGKRKGAFERGRMVGLIHSYHKRRRKRMVGRIIYTRGGWTKIIDAGRNIF